MTVFARFSDEFPDQTETRILLMLNRVSRREIGRIYLDERYCADPECDCQRVLLHVHDQATNLLAGIMYDLLGRVENTPARLNPYLEPTMRQPSGAPEVLGYVTAELDRDPTYRERLRRHYAELKLRTRDPAHPLWPSILADRRVMRGVAGEVAAELLGRPGAVSPLRLVRSQQEKNRAKRERRRQRRR